MMETLTFDLEMDKKWKNTFKLKSDWENNNRAVISGILALGTLAAEVSSGYFLARQKISIKSLIPLNSQLALKGEVTKRKESMQFCYITCRAQVILGEEVIVELDSTLVKPNQHKETQNSIADYTLSQGEKWRSFSVAEIRSFAQLSGDPNPIHTGENPVVQGLLILLALEDEFSLANKSRGQCNIQYLNPIKANDEIKIVKEALEIIGIVNNKKCFSLKYGGE